MPRIHLLNVSPGDCTIIEHASEKASMIDICDGNLGPKGFLASLAETGNQGNFRMCESPSNPIEYAKSLGLNSIFRFVLSHPDMDHMDGLKALNDSIGILNFWDTGSRRPKPSFENGPYREEDWDLYEEIRDGRSGVSTAIRQAGARFAYANKNEDGTGGGDGLHILAPDSQLIRDPNFEDDVNEGSYVIQYLTGSAEHLKNLIFPGDAHDSSWEFIAKNFASDVATCTFLLAPHHGRDSGRSYDFLDLLRPKLTLIGCAPSKYIDYNQWYRRNLPIITSNQCGNVVLETDGAYLHVYVQNREFAKSRGKDTSISNRQGYTYLQSL